MSEYDLRKEVRASCSDVTGREFSILSRVRLAFWEEYERAAHAQEIMDAHGLYRATCRSEIYYKLYDRYPALLAWVVCPLVGFLLQRKELEFLAEERMIEVMSVSAVKVDGKVDSRLAKVQLEMYQTLQDRIYGGVTQKIQSEQKSLNVNVNSNSEEIATKSIALITSVDELERRIEVVRAKRAALSNISQPIEINQNKLMRPDLVDDSN